MTRFVPKAGSLDAGFGPSDGSGPKAKTRIKILISDGKSFTATRPSWHHACSESGRQVRCVCKNPLCRERVFCRLTPASAKHAGVSADDPNEPVAIPITGELDLHTFRPTEVGDLLENYFTECRRRGLLRVRVVHGKGTGTLRTTVHTCLRRSPVVLR